MAVDSPFNIVIYDKDFNVTGFVADPIYCNFVPAWTDNPYGNFMLDADNPHSEALQAKGARVTVTFRGEHLLSGPIRSRQGDVLDNGTVTYQVLGDKAMLDWVVLQANPTEGLQATSLDDPAQAWNLDVPPPAGTVTGQYPYYKFPDGSAATGGLVMDSAETAIKHVITSQMVVRLGLPITVLPNQHRGGDIQDVIPALKFVPMKEVLTPFIEKSNLGVKFWQEEYGDTIFMDVFEPGTYEQELTVESGIITGGSYSVHAPDVTRSVVGGAGETAGRIYYSNEERPGWRTRDEQDWHQIIEVFRDASNGTDMAWPDSLAEKYRVPKYYQFQVPSYLWSQYLTTLKQEANAGLAQGPSTTSLALKLAETEVFHFGGADGFQIGDTVSVDIRGAKFTDRITSAYFDFTRDDGLKIMPIVGDYEDNPDRQLAEYVASISRALRRIQASR